MIAHRLEFIHLSLLRIYWVDLLLFRVRNALVYLISQFNQIVRVGSLLSLGESASVFMNIFLAYAVDFRKFFYEIILSEILDLVLQNSLIFKFELRNLHLHQVVVFRSRDELVLRRSECLVLGWERSLIHLLVHLSPNVMRVERAFVETWDRQF